MRNVLNSTHKSTVLLKLPSRLYLCQSQEYLAVIVRLGEASEKCIKYKLNKKKKKHEYFLFLPEKKVCLYLLKTKKIPPK